MLEQRILIEKRQQHEHEMSYYLIIEQLDSSLVSFGAAIVDQTGNEMCVRGITISEAKIMSFLFVLIQAFVTPVTLRDVVDDWLLW